MSTFCGHLLVASPHLADPNFKNTVILMVQHDDQGALGLILNRPTDKSVKEVWAQLSKEHCPRSESIYFGGPVPGPLMALHREVTMSDTEVADGVHLTMQPEKLEDLITEPSTEVSFFVGHAGWSGGQLEGEWEEGGWMTLPAKAELVFCSWEDLWEDVTKQIGRSMLLPLLEVKHIPEDPSVN